MSAGLSTSIGLGTLALSLWAFTLTAELPSPHAGDSSDASLTTIIYSADGTELGRYYRKNRTWVPLDEIAPSVTQALLATEDRRFYDHSGIDVIRLVKAAYETARGHRQGASTITMQLARNLYDSIASAPLLERKLKEILMALRLEQRHSKDDLLETYLNTVPFGHRAFGIEAAAQTYFSKSARAMRAPEAALLIGMLKGPTHYNPLRHPERAMQRRNLVLRQMMIQGDLRDQAYVQFRTAPLGLNVQSPTLTTSPAPYFAEHVRRWLEDWTDRHGYDLYTDGLRVYTTLDSELQRLARAAVDSQMAGLQAVVAHEWSQPTPSILAHDFAPYYHRRVERRSAPFAYLWQQHPHLLDTYIRRTPRYRQRVRQGHSPGAVLADLRTKTSFIDSLKRAHTRLKAGFVAIDPRTGAIKAWVGGRSFKQDKYDKVALARRQPGSTFKPFVYTAAIDYGYAPYDTTGARNAPPERLRRPSTLPARISPTEATSFTLREGLAYSRNATALRLTREMGPHSVARMAHRLGIESPLTPVPSLALGTSEVTLLEMASAYGTLAAQGQRQPPRSVTHIEDHQGNRIATFRPAPKRAISRHLAYTVLDMMRDVVDRGTGWPIRHSFGITADVAGKTGTTQHGADGWFILMHPELVTGAWVGFNDRRLSFRTEYWEQGAHNALRLVGDFFKRALRTHPTWRSAHFEPPPGYRTPTPPTLNSSSWADGSRLTGAPPTFGVYRDSARSEASLSDPLIRQAQNPESRLRRTLRATSSRSAPPSPSDALTRRSANPEEALRRTLQESPSTADSVGNLP